MKQIFNIQYTYWMQGSKGRWSSSNYVVSIIKRQGKPILQPRKGLGLQGMLRYKF
jgi:hypothetical protein